MMEDLKVDQIQRQRWKPIVPHLYFW